MSPGRKSSVADETLLASFCGDNFTRKSILLESLYSALRIGLALIGGRYSGYFAQLCETGRSNGGKPLLSSPNTNAVYPRTPITSVIHTKEMRPMAKKIPHDCYFSTSVNPLGLKRGPKLSCRREDLGIPETGYFL